MQWKNLTSEQDLQNAINHSGEKPVLLFKHSTRCSISRTTLDRLERNWKEADTEKITPYFLDLIQYRSVSNAIATQLNIEHESPQALVVYKNKVVYHASHFDIGYADIISTTTT
jgi:bacillithiol system protein YtxJ